MGHLLSQPVETKHTHSDSNNRYAYAVSEMQGWRVSMEDAHATILSLEEPSDPNPNAFFAVYDGHGGATISKYAGDHVHKRLVGEAHYKQKLYQEALKKAFLGTDEDLRADPTFFNDPSGCTAVAALFTDDRRILVANAGDSRSVLSSKGYAKAMSYDHKPENEGESARIRAAGGYVEFGRVNGNLALSRAIGDFEFKKNYTLSPEDQVITANPEIIEHQITEDDEFLIIACDGIWDCLSSQQSVDFVRRSVANGKPLAEICEDMMNHCLAPDNDRKSGIGMDNMTVLIVAILNGRTLEEWAAWVKERVEGKVGNETPEDLPEVYAPIRIQNAERQRQQGYNNDANGGPLSLRGTGISALARVLAGGGISFIPSSGGVMSNSGILNYDDDEDSNEDDMDRGWTPTKSLKDQLEELSNGANGAEDEDEEMEDIETGGEGATVEEVSNTDGDDDQTHGTGQAHQELFDHSTPSPPGSPVVVAATPAQGTSSPLPPQLSHRPDGDVPSAAVKAEGLMDSSESPLKV
ncbi:PP2C-domain-containing protein [Sistotremastrum suecicum HHB10207 ss-3]|uniref:protein-serine/threonine phosphatase n=1 Tax=Sistotremastrum suecicum HHB10207 ss-3 TaxID=1314776 RepID=A0A165ZJP8_9AGAM|nr:PP2C-domain-containing protein [Sistotremastrum suecicum HHB10207 ss-3]